MKIFYWYICCFSQGRCVMTVLLSLCFLLAGNLKMWHILKCTISSSVKIEYHLALSNDWLDKACTYTSSIICSIQKLLRGCKMWRNTISLVSRESVNMKVYCFDGIKRVYIWRITVSLVSRVTKMAPVSRGCKSRGILFHQYKARVN